MARTSASRHESPWVRPAAAASELGISPGTMAKWIRAGLVKAHKTPTGNYMLRREDVERVYKESRPK